MIIPRSLIQQSQVLSALFSPTFPVGAFSYSHGMETAIANNLIVDGITTHDWIRTCLVGGGGRNDAIIMAQLWRDSKSPASILNELVFALCASPERVRETKELGDNFVRITNEVYEVEWQLNSPISYPLATGIAAKQLGCSVDMTLVFFLQAFVCNLISVAVRMVPLGQTEGQVILQRLMLVIRDIASEAASSDLDRLGGHAFGADQAAQMHGMLDVRLYRT